MKKIITIIFALTLLNSCTNMSNNSTNYKVEEALILIEKRKEYDKNKKK